MKNKIKELIDKLGVKKLAIIGAILVIAIVGTVVGVSVLKPANEIVEEDTNKDKDSDIDKEEADKKTEVTETRGDVAQETVVEEETTEEQVETTEDTTSTTTSENTNSNSSTNSTTTTTKPSNSTSSNNTNNNSSTNQNTQTQTPTATPTPTANTWFDKMGFKITPWTSNLCYSNVAGHTCNSNFSISETTDYWNCGAGQKTVMLTHNHFCECFDGYSFLPVDRYTGTVLEYSEEFMEFETNGKTISVWGARGAGGGIFEDLVVCPADYDGVVFVLAKWEFPENHNANLRAYTADEFIDFSAGNYYFFSYTNK